MGKFGSFGAWQFLVTFLVYTYKRCPLKIPNWEVFRVSHCPEQNV